MLFSLPVRHRILLVSAPVLHSTKKVLHMTSAAASPAVPSTSALVEQLRSSGLLRDQCFVAGKWVGASQPASAPAAPDAGSAGFGPTIPVTNPATGEVLTHVPNLGADDTRAAISAAQAAQAQWRSRTAKQRADALRRLYSLMVAAREDLATLMTLEQGKPLAEARGEVDYSAGYVQFYAEEAVRAYGDILPTSAPGRRSLVLPQPVGVVGIITPWNFPLAMISRKLAPALAAGCAVIAKPSEFTPLSALALAVLVERCPEFPAGLFSVITGDARPIGQELLGSAVVRKLSFTGSTGVGKLLMAQAAATVKRLSLELGGNAPFLVFDDADLPAAVAALVGSKFRNSGQTCVCPNRVLVQAGAAPAFLQLLQAAMKEKLHLGPGLAPGVTQGPLINAAAVDKVERHVADAVAKGGQLLLGGKRAQGVAGTGGSSAGGQADGSDGGLFFEPTLVVGATADMACFQEETFGPLCAVAQFATEEEAVALANAVPAGLAAYLFSGSLARCWRVAEALQYGMVGVNEAAISDPAAPFGGVKESGFGREGSKYGLQEYMEIKYVCLGGLS